MFKLLNFEFRKLIRQKSFYICIGAMLLFTLVSDYTTVLSLEEAGVEDAGLSGIAQLMQAVNNSALTTVMAVFIPLFVCEDFASGTIRNIITRGYSRLAVFSSKLITVLIATVIMTALCLAGAYLSGTLFWGAGEDGLATEQLKILLYQLALILAHASVYFAISHILQKTGGSIALCLVLSMAVLVILSLADAALTESEIVLADYWIDRLLSSVSGIEVEAEALKKALISAGCYFAASVTAAWLVVMKREY